MSADEKIKELSIILDKINETLLWKLKVYVKSWQGLCVAENKKKSCN